MATPSLRQLATAKKNNNSTGLWQSLKAPALFGVGLYLGLVAFGGHQETKEGSAYFAGLRGMFWGSDDGGERGINDTSKDASKKDEKWWA